MRKWFLPVVISMSLLASLFIMSLWRPVRVAAQGQTQSFTFNIPVTSTATTQPIPNFNQIGHTVTFTYTLANPPLGSNCQLYLEASNDNIVWSIIAAGQNANGELSGTTTTNGYFQQYRLFFSACPYESVKAIYSGYGSVLPISTISLNAGNIQVSTVTGTGIFGTPVVLTGLQCTNPSTTLSAWLQLFQGVISPTLGTSVPFYQVQLPANATFGYFGPPIPLYLGQTANILWLGASTTQSGATPVAAPFVCNVQLNISGPFYPLLPAGP